MPMCVRLGSAKGWKAERTPANRARRGSGDAGTVVRVAGGRSRLSTAGPAKTAHLIRKCADVDRLAEEAGETRLQQPIVIADVGQGAQSDDWNVRRSISVAELACDVGADHVGETEVQQDQVRQALRREGDCLGPASRLERSEAGRAKHVPGEFPVLLVVVDDEDERDSRSRAVARPHLENETSSPYPRSVPIRIVLAEDQYLVREGLRRLLETRDELVVAAVCGDLDSLLDAVAAERPDVVVTDIRMPPGSTDEGIQAASRLRETNPEVGVVVLSQYATPSYVLALLKDGSQGRAYLLKERVSDVEQLVAAIDAVAEGGSVLDPKVVEALVAENARAEGSPLNELTPRERDVLREMAEGKNNAAIGEALFLSERSVEKVIHSIFLKLGLTWETAVHKRVKAVVLYLAESG